MHLNFRESLNFKGLFWFSTLRNSLIHDSLLTKDATFYEFFNVPAPLAAASYAGLDGTSIKDLIISKFSNDSAERFMISSRNTSCCKKTLNGQLGGLSVAEWNGDGIGWDESTAGERQPRVSLWEIEPLTTFPMYPSPFPLRLKRPTGKAVDFLGELQCTDESQGHHQHENYNVLFGNCRSID
ncbi:hypothetical protein ACFE04_027468 [Oxalis oulophora]